MVKDLNQWVYQNLFAWLTDENFVQKLKTPLLNKFIFTFHYHNNTKCLHSWVEPVSQSI